MAWFEKLAEVCKRLNWTCHAYCQITNHYHLIIETLDANRSKGMRQLNGVYSLTTNWFRNFKHCRVNKPPRTKRCHCAVHHCADSGVIPAFLITPRQRSVSETI